jgi:hypothetical protein
MMWVQWSIKLTSAVGEFWSKKSTVPTGIVAIADITSLPLTFTLSDFKLHKEWSLTLNKLGTKERSYTMRDEG